MEKQLDCVLNLVEKLKSCSFNFYFYLSEQTRQEYNINDSQLQEIGNSFVGTEKYQILERKMNLFSVSKLNKHNRFICSKKIYFHDISITPESMKKFQEFNQFYSDPLLPKSIANKLAEFALSPEDFLIGQMKAENKSLDYVKIGDLLNDDSGSISDISNFATESTGNAFRSWENFIQCSQELSKAIRDWMRNNGITEINL